MPVPMPVHRLPCCLRIQAQSSLIRWHACSDPIPLSVTPPCVFPLRSALVFSNVRTFKPLNCLVGNKLNFHLKERDDALANSAEIAHICKRCTHIYRVSEYAYTYILCASSEAYHCRGKARQQPVQTCRQEPQRIGRGRSRSSVPNGESAPPFQGDLHSIPACCIA